MNDETLLPCPFCGGRAEIKVGGYTKYVMCLKCEVMSANLSNAAELIQAWNTRAQASAPEGETFIGKWRKAINATMPCNGCGYLACDDCFDRHAQEQGYTRSNAKAGEVESSLHVECRQCDVCDHIGINDASATEGACHNCDWSGPEQAEDKCPKCGDTDCMAAACPECGSRYALLTDTRIALSTHDKTKA